MPCVNIPGSHRKGTMKVRFIRVDGRRKPGMHARMTHAKATEMIAKGIVERYDCPQWGRRSDKMKFNLKNLTRDGGISGADFRNSDSSVA